MRRSEIDTIIDEARATMRRHGVALPPFADWSPQDWQRHGAATRTMRDRLIGWNIAEFEKDAFARSGIALITTRMGDFEQLPTGRGKLYGEKIFVIREGQSVPYHYHWVKTEDVFNRGGATLAIDLVAVDSQGRPTDAAIDLDRDGLPHHIVARGTIRLSPGEGDQPRSRHRPCLPGRGRGRRLRRDLSRQ